MSNTERREFITWLRDNRVMTYRDSEFQVAFDPIDSMPTSVDALPKSMEPKSPDELKRLLEEKYIYRSS